MKWESFRGLGYLPAARVATPVINTAALVRALKAKAPPPEAPDDRDDEGDIGVLARFMRFTGV